MSKSPEAFRTISEVADWLGVQTHVLRFWESRFSQVKPVKRAGGRRYYRPSDMALLGGIKTLLHDDGVTIRGVQKVLRERGVKYVAGLSAPLVVDPEPDVAPAPQDAEPQEPFVVQEQVGFGVAEQYEEEIEDPSEDFFAAAGADGQGLDEAITSEPEPAPPDSTGDGGAENATGADEGTPPLDLAADTPSADEAPPTSEPVADATPSDVQATAEAPVAQPDVAVESTPEERPDEPADASDASGAAPDEDPGDKVPSTDRPPVTEDTFRMADPFLTPEFLRPPTARTDPDLSDQERMALLYQRLEVLRDRMKAEMLHGG